MPSLSNQFLPSDPGMPWANQTRGDTPLPGGGWGGQDRILAGFYAVQKNKDTPPRPIFAGGQKTVNM